MAGESVQMEQEVIPCPYCGGETWISVYGNFVLSHSGLRKRGCPYCKNEHEQEEYRVFGDARTVM